MNSGIYQITHKDTGRIYIGQSKNFAQRIRHYKNCNKRKENTYIENAIKKYGWDAFNFEVLVYADGKEFLDLLETKIIDGFSSTTPNGFNVRLGGNTSSFSAATRGKMSQIKIAYFKDPKAKERLREKRKLQVIPVEAYRLRGLRARGFKWMNNGLVACKVHPDNIESKQQEGFVFGRLQSYITESYRQTQKQRANVQWAKVKQSGHAGNLVKV